MSRWHRTDEEQRGYDAYKEHSLSRSCYDGGYDYEQGWDEAAREERRERERLEEQRMEQAREEYEERRRHEAYLEEQRQEELEQPDQPNE